MPTIFSKIITGEIPCYRVAENDHFMAFLDIQPIAKGHTLVIPKVEVDYIFDLEDQLLCELMLFAKSVAGGIRRSIPCDRVGVSVIGLEVPHAHVHLIPIQQLSDMDFGKSRLSFSADEYSAIAQGIAAEI